MKGTSPSRGVRAKAEYGNELPRWEVRTLINSLQNGKSKSIVYVGIDLAKNAFAVHGVDAAGKRPAMRFVPIKTEQQMSQLMVHRTRQGFVQSRTACINRIPGLLAEFGHVLPLKADSVRRQAHALLEDLPAPLP